MKCLSLSYFGFHLVTIKSMRYCNFQFVKVSICSVFYEFFQRISIYMIQRIRRQVSSYKCVAILSYVPLRYEIESLHFFSNNVHAYIVEPREVLSRPTRARYWCCVRFAQCSNKRLSLTVSLR